MIGGLSLQNTGHFCCFWRLAPLGLGGRLGLAAEVTRFAQGDVVDSMVRRETRLWLWSRHSVVPSFVPLLNRSDFFHDSSFYHLLNFREVYSSQVLHVLRVDFFERVKFEVSNLIKLVVLLNAQSFERWRLVLISSRVTNRKSIVNLNALLWRILYSLVCWGGWAVNR